MLLTNEKGKPASLDEVCDWIVYHYPTDIFVTEPKAVIRLRDAAMEICARHSQGGI